VTCYQHFNVHNVINRIRNAFAVVNFSPVIFLNIVGDPVATMACLAR